MRYLSPSRHCSRVLHQSHPMISNASNTHYSEVTLHHLHQVMYAGFP